MRGETVRTRLRLYQLQISVSRRPDDVVGFTEAGIGSTADGGVILDCFPLFLGGSRSRFEGASWRPKKKQYEESMKPTESLGRFGSPLIGFSL